MTQPITEPTDQRSLVMATRSGDRFIAPTFGLILVGLTLVGCGTPPQKQGAVVSSGSASPVAGVTASPVTTPGDVCGGASSLTSGPSAQPSPAATSSPSGASGAITGSTGIPPGGVAPSLIYAISTSGASHGAYSTETVAGQFSYTIKGVAPGEYHVYSALRPLVCKGHGTVVGAAYSEFATSGSPSASHDPLPVIVKGGSTTDRVDPADWYTSDKTVPAPPIA